MTGDEDAPVTAGAGVRSDEADTLAGAADADPDAAAGVEDGGADNVDDGSG